MFREKWHRMTWRAIPARPWLRAARELAEEFQWNPATHELYGAALAATVVTVEVFECVAPVVTRGLCLGRVVQV